MPIDFLATASEPNWWRFLRTKSNILLNSNGKGMAQALPTCHGQSWVKIVCCHFDSFYIGFRHLFNILSSTEVLSTPLGCQGWSLQWWNNCCWRVLAAATAGSNNAFLGGWWRTPLDSPRFFKKKSVGYLLQCEIILNVKRNHFLSTAIVGLSWLFYILLILSIFPKAFPQKAFACPAAVVSSFFSLARVMAMQQRLRRALALIHLGTMDGTPSQELET